MLDRYLGIAVTATVDVVRTELLVESSTVLHPCQPMVEENNRRYESWSGVNQFAVGRADHVLGHPVRYIFRIDWFTDPWEGVLELLRREVRVAEPALLQFIPGRVRQMRLECVDRFLNDGKSMTWNESDREPGTRAADLSKSDGVIP